MANIKKRTTDGGKVKFQVQVRLKGRPAQFATFGRLTDAKKWASATETAIREGRHFKGVEARRHTFAELVTRYLADVMPNKRPSSRRNQIMQLEWFKGKLGAYVLADITPGMIADLRDELARGEVANGERRSPTTVGRYLAALSHCFSVAVREWQWLEDNPCARVRKPTPAPGRVRFLSDDERARLLAACRTSRNKALYDIVILAISTGMRKGEIESLTWEKVDFARGVIILEPGDTKNKRRRVIPLVGVAAEAMRERARLRRIDTPLCFPAPYSRGKTQRTLNFRNAFEYALKEAEIANFKFHDLRHCTASYLAMGGASLNEIAEVLGHRTLAMVQRYAHLSEAHTSGIVAKMNAAIFKTPEKAQASE